MDLTRLSVDLARTAPSRRVEYGRSAFYLGAIAGVSCLLSAVTGAAVSASGGAVALGWLSGLLSLPITTRIGQQAVNAALRAVRPPARALPALAGPAADAAAAVTCFVYPVLVRDERDVDDLVSTIRATAQGAGPGFAGHIALVDFGDSPTATDAHDEHLRSLVEQRLRAESRRCPDIAAQALFRARCWGPSEGVWMGWERKRGKILEFARLVAGSTNTSYTVDSQTEQDLVRRLHGLRYVVTLDAQSQLHPGGARQLISILAHPANQAVIDPGNGRVVAGFCFVRPLVVFREPTSLFAWATRPKRRPSEAPALQQHFGRDYFLGQGAIDIRTFLAVFDTAIPDSTVLSHDKLEGMHARAICDIDTLIVDDAPEDYLVARLRDHRWVRGDFQLVRWIFAGRGSRVRQLPALERYLLLDDLLHHVSPAATVTLLALGWLRLPAPAAGLFTAGVVLIPLLADHAIFEPLIRFGRYCRRYPGPGQPGPLPEDPSLHDSTSHVTRQITAELVSLPIWIILLPDRAVQNLDAALRALYRSFVSHQLTLQWTPSRAGSRSVGPTMMLRWRVMSASCVISAVLLACVWVVNPVALPSALPVLAVWLAAPVIVYQIGRAARRLPFTARPSAADGA